MQESEVRNQEPVGKTYELVIPEWRGQVLAEWKLEICRTEEWCEAPTEWPLSLYQGQRLRAGSESGQALLEAMLAHGYVKEVQDAELKE